MEKYISRDVVEATPMSQKEHKEHIGYWELRNDDPDPEGYLILKDNFETWMSKNDFENLYCSVESFSSDDITRHSEILDYIIDNYKGEGKRN